MRLDDTKKVTNVGESLRLFIGLENGGSGWDDSSLQYRGWLVVACKITYYLN